MEKIKMPQLPTPIVKMLDGTDNEYDINKLQFACVQISGNDIAHHSQQIATVSSTGLGVIIVFCVSGRAGFILNDKNYDFVAGEVLSITTDTDMKITSCSEDMVCYALFVSLRYTTEIDTHLSISYFLHSFSNPIATVAPHNIEVTRELLRIAKILDDKKERPYKVEIIHHMMMILLYELCDIYQSQSSDKPRSIHLRDEELLREFLKLVDNNCERERALGFYANELYITPKHLSLCIKRISGRSGAEWIDLILLMKIKKVLRSSSMTIQQVADMFNFPSHSFFGKYFKKHTGLTPREFKMTGMENYKKEGSHFAKQLSTE